MRSRVFSPHHLTGSRTCTIKFMNWIIGDKVRDLFGNSITMGGGNSIIVGALKHSNNQVHTYFDKRASGCTTKGSPSVGKATTKNLNCLFKSTKMATESSLLERQGIPLTHSFVSACTQSNRNRFRWTCCGG